jgi:hypothetical protein
MEADDVSPIVADLPLSAPGSRIVPLQAFGAGREAWLVKVPAVFAELVECSVGAQTIGTLLPVEGSSTADTATGGARARALVKRQRTRLVLSVDAGLLTSLPSDVKLRTPSRYELSLDPATGHAGDDEPSALAVAFAPATGFSVIGGVRQSGTLTANAADPAYQVRC